ncbi:MAG: hypothetical protein AB1938_20470 [Myxococcota bacterium]
MPAPLNRTYSRGVRTDYPEPRTPKADVAAPKPAAKSAMTVTFEAAPTTGALKDVSAAKATSLEQAFNAPGAKTENLSAGRVGASIQGLVVDGELFVRTKAVRPGATPKWASAGPLKDAKLPKADDVAKPKGWGTKPKSLEARVQKTVAERMGLLSRPEFQLKASEVAELKQSIAKGECRPSARRRRASPAWA